MSCVLGWQAGSKAISPNLPALKAAQPLPAICLTTVRSATFGLFAGVHVGTTFAALGDVLCQKAAHSPPPIWSTLQRWTVKV